MDYHIETKVATESLDKDEPFRKQGRDIIVRAEDWDRALELVEDVYPHIAAILADCDLTLTSTNVVRRLLEDRWKLPTGLLDLSPAFIDKINEVTTAEVARIQDVEAQQLVPFIRNLFSIRHYEKMFIADYRRHFRMPTDTLAGEGRKVL